MQKFIMAQVGRPGSRPQVPHNRALVTGSLAVIFHPIWLKCTDFASVGTGKDRSRDLPVIKQVLPDPVL